IKQLLAFAAADDSEQVRDVCLAALANADFVSRFAILRTAVWLLSIEHGDELIAEAGRRDAAVALLGRDVIENDRREAFLIRRRVTVSDPGLRFFLAVLLNVRGRSRALEVIQKRFGEQDPVDLIVQWVRSLGALPSPSKEDKSALGFPL